MNPDSKLKSVAVRVNNQFGETSPGVAKLITRTPREAFWEGGRRAFKIIAIIFGCSLPLAFLEPFMFMVWGSVLLAVLVFIIGPYLHHRFSGETVSFTEVESKCPHCHSETQLKPYLSTQFEDSFTVICPLCGQTAQVMKEESQ